MTTETLDLWKVRIDGGTQMRAALDEHTIQDYAEEMAAGAQFPPPVVFFDGSEYWMADGFHRFEAHRRASRSAGQAGAPLTVEVRAGTRRDAVLHAAAANGSHGLRRTQNDKRRAIETLLRDAEWGQWSDNEIARRCAVSPTTVGTIRRSLSKLDSDTRTYTTKHGTPATMRVAAIGAQPSTVPPLPPDMAAAGWTVHKDGPRFHATNTATLEHVDGYASFTNLMHEIGERMRRRPAAHTPSAAGHLEPDRSAAEPISPDEVAAAAAEIRTLLAEQPDRGAAMLANTFPAGWEIELMRRFEHRPRAVIEHALRQIRLSSPSPVVTEVTDQISPSADIDAPSTPHTGHQPISAAPPPPAVPLIHRSLDSDPAGRPLAPDRVPAAFSGAPRFSIADSVNGSRQDLSERAFLSDEAAADPGTALPSRLAVHYSSASDTWETPQELFDILDAEFDFTLDVCATPFTAKCDHYFTPADDGLRQSWANANLGLDDDRTARPPVCWMNPPYGRTISDWMRKAWLEAVSGATVVCLVPARTDTAWWWDYALHGEIRFLRGRLRFGAGDNGAPFPSALVVFHPGVPPHLARVVWWTGWNAREEDA